MDKQLREDIDTVWKAHKSLTEVTGKKAKVALMADMFDDSLVYETFKFLINPYVTTNIGRKSVSKVLEAQELLECNKEIPFSDLLGLLRYLEVSSGKDVEVAVAVNVLLEVEDKYKDLVTAIITKTGASFGVGISLFNEVCKLKGLPICPNFSVMLAKPALDGDDWDSGARSIVTPKMDGIRGVAIKENGLITFYSRKGMKIGGLQYIIADMAHLPDDQVYDGELLVENINNLSSLDLYRETQSVVRSKEGHKENVNFHMFDTMPVNEFYEGASKLKYTERRAFLDSLPVGGHLKVVPVLLDTTDSNEIRVLASKLIAEGDEGIMLNNPDAVYETKRTKNLLKIKNVISVDGVITGFYKGKDGGKYENTLGGVYVTYKDSTTKVGGGLSDEVRDHVWNNQEDYLGKVLEYLISEESRNAKGGTDVRHGRWVGIREDKGPEDVNYDG